MPRPGPETYREHVGKLCAVRRWACGHALLADGLLACLLLLPSLLYLYTNPSVGSRPAALITLTVITTLSLAVCRRWPRPVLAVAVCGAAAGALLGYAAAPVAPVVVAIFVLSAATDRRQAALAFGATLLVLVPAVTVFAPRAWPLAQTLGLVSWSGLAAAAGEAIRSRRAYVAAVEERAERAERTREQEAARRVAEERMRIARDLHDAVAHHIALVNAQAGAALYVLEQRPDQARTALGHIQEASRYALDELRATVGLLRQSGDPAAPLEPAPGLNRLAELARGFEPTGLRVAVTLSGRQRTVPTTVDVTAYRIVQEALTNVHKHADADAARVEVAYLPDRLTITVDDDGPARVRAASGPGDGFGLIGMRERAAVVGGRLEALPRAEGGYRVTAQLPLHPSGLPAGDGCAP
jgi:signal transduction histidine kinase